MKKWSIQLAACLTGLVLIVFVFYSFDLSKATMIENEIIVLFNTEADDHIITKLNHSPYKFNIIEYQYDYMLLSTEADRTDESLSYLNGLDFVLVAERNHEISLNHISNQQQYLNHLQPQFVSINTASRNEVIVAVLDTGIDYNHLDLSPYMWINKGEIDNNGMDDDKNGYIDDIYGWDFYNNDASVCHSIIDENGMPIADPDDNDNHGTHCAGIITSSLDKEAVNVKIMVLKIHGGKDGKGSIANAIKAIRYACIMGADICNMSWGTSIYSEALEQVMGESDMLFVTAAGNDGRDISDYPIYPACFNLDNMIVVAFSDERGKIAYGSNYSNQYVDITAPGINIKSTIVGSYAIMNGSSMAAPYISGIAASLYSNSRYMYPSDVKRLLLAAIEPSPDNEKFVAYPGTLNQEAIVSYKTHLLKDALPPKLDIKTSYQKDKLLLTFSKTDSGGSGVRVLKYAPGLKLLKDFRKGTTGTSVKTNQLELLKAGQYTFYISDYAGNEALYHYMVIDDDKPPMISASYCLTSSKNLYMITADIMDDKSGIKLVKYMEGDKTADDFRSSFMGTTVEQSKSGSYSFQVKQAGKYSIYALDHRGNSTVYIIQIPKINMDIFYLNEYFRLLKAGNILF